MPQSAASSNISTVLVLNGPNLNRLGKRQPEIYGATTLADVEEVLKEHGRGVGVEVICKQSNHEGELIDWVHEAADNSWPVIINPGGLTHTSVALRDALAEVADGPGFIEVHISNVHAREPFRAHSYLSPIARGVIAGLGVKGYVLALEALVDPS
ncbi:type II 3-dehydroquinate dehydratase [Corynebacterium sp. 153RC1]|uniref:type II 3-dehydroquinate dehydratase n=1 Tax=Corynebacterium TaxID=1716 RepID=UPI00211C9C91|nr:MULTISPECIES: type II 3-dehydroquinate dehydratase [unclassified Corynebacterium]MCQ9369684.1 type II 3-dehydroquinate dehydratase [Corynebacterium sp. 35RC1]MCQ9342778.1 type II 3-dehydroquinate dehydratase [Corynebacterium sp. 76QC2CO]MCQ9351468.1 type II 3-dehydroquinate dehydratase [Corynebacterium sp. 209RC1]MCQ9354597.1 type II 3-dehydroquinate dehydratase [Corynebacterium sp. 1222RC1]MCQ9357346.1 type II 3-dehydroquinate dehydratase [Corynebacterium sp. 122RC1]